MGALIVLFILGLLSAAIAYFVFSLMAFCGGWTDGLQERKELTHNSWGELRKEGMLPAKSLQENCYKLFPNRVSVLVPTYALGYVIGYYVVHWMTEPLGVK